MNTNRLIGTIALSLASLTLLSINAASPARSESLPRSAYDCTSAVSLIVAPNGRCYNLTYLSMPSQSAQSPGQTSSPAVQPLRPQPSHLAVMHEISRDFASRRTVPPLTLQRLGLAK